MDVSLAGLSEGNSRMTAAMSALSPDGLMDVFMAVWYDLNRGSLARTPAIAQFINKCKWKC